MGLFVGLFVGLGVRLSTSFIVGREVGTFVIVVGRGEGRCVGDFVLDTSWIGLAVGLGEGIIVVGFGVII